MTEQYIFITAIVVMILALISALIQTNKLAKTKGYLETSKKETLLSEARVKDLTTTMEELQTTITAKTKLKAAPVVKKAPAKRRTNRKPVKK